MNAAGGRRPVGVAVAGFGWMGRVHTQAHARVLHHFPELTLAPQLVAVADEVPGRAEELGDAYQYQPVSTVHVGPGHGAYAAFQPGAAIAMGFDDLKVIEAYNFLRSVAEVTSYGTTVADAVRSAAILDAMARSAETGTWVKVART